MAREKLPGGFETRYRSEPLKEKIAEEGMWQLCPAIPGDLQSDYGIERLWENDLLLSFVDEYFTLDKFAFEPNMQDGRFVFLPYDVRHQGVAVSVSKQLPGFLEVGQFWYPGEFTEKRIKFTPLQQAYAPAFWAKPGQELVDFVRRLYIEESRPQMRCTFPFTADLVVTLDGYFLDDLDASIKKISDALRYSSSQVRRNGQGLIEFMQWVTE